MSLRTFKFEEGLAPGDWLEILTGDPLFEMMGQILPGYGGSTRPAHASPHAVLLTGAATVCFQSDRQADAHLRRYWSFERDRWGTDTLILPESPVLSGHWRYYRDTYLTEEVVAEMWELLRDGAAHYARELGLFSRGPADYRRPDPNRTVFADGTVFAPASRVGHGTGKDIHPSRSQTGNPRYIADMNVQGKMVGYAHVVLFAQQFDPVTRMSVPRSRIVLDAARVRETMGASKGGEMAEVIPAARRLRNRVGDGLTHLVYDGAMRGTHMDQLAAMGVVGVNKPHGIRTQGQLEDYDDKPVDKDKVFTVTVDGCAHRLSYAFGHLWATVESPRGVRRAEILEVTDVRRSSAAEGYTFEADLAVLCGANESHRLTLSMHTGSRIPGSRKKVPADLALVPMADQQVFGPAYGQRNSAEAAFSLFKNHRGMGPRAQSYNGLRHEIDLLMASVVNNALVRAEFRQRRVSRRAA